MARFASGASASSGRLGKRSRNASETASLSSWGSEVNVLSDNEEISGQVPKKRRSLDSAASFNLDMSEKNFSSSDEDSQQQNSTGSTRGKKPKCFSRNAVLARQNRLKKKKYIEDLENELQVLRRENSKLKLSLDGYSKDVQLVRKENVYLRNVLANSKEISQLLRSINVSCSNPTPSSIVGSAVPRPVPSEKEGQPKVVVQSVAPSTTNTDFDCLDSCVPSAVPLQSSTHVARTAKRDYPIAADDVSLSLSAPEDDDDDLDVLFGRKDIPTELDLNLNDPDYLGFGPNAFGDWLDGDEPLANIGVCLHVAKKKVSLEFCSSCNENALSSWSGITV